MIFIKKNIVILIVIFGVIISVGIGGFIFKDKSIISTTFIKQSQQLSKVQSRKLTVKDLKRLKSYPLNKNADSNNDFDDMEIAYNTGSIIIERLYSCWSPQDNQRFLTQKDLTYITYTGKYAIRGVLIEKLEDGSFNEKDVEFLIRADRLNDDKDIYKVEYLKTLSDI